MLGLGPFGALMLLGTGLVLLLGEPFGAAVAAPLYGCALVLLAPGLLYHLFRPRWWGPRWFRELAPEQCEPDLSDPHTALSALLSRRREVHSGVAAEVYAGAFGGRLARWRANLIYDPDTRQRAHGLTVRGGIGGVLALHQGGLVFAGNWAEDRLRQEPTVLAVPMSDIRGARVVPARAGVDGVPRPGFLHRSLFRRLVVDTSADALLFEVRRAERVAALLAKVTGTRPPAAAG